MTKEQQIIERLASKELSFGCYAKMPYYKDKVVIIASDEDQTKKFPLFSIKTDTAKHPQGRYGKFHFEILGHPVYIGDVLKKVKSIYGNSIEWLSYSHSLVDKWEPLGLDKALQQIVEEAGDEEVCMDCVEGSECSCEDESVNLKKRLKSPQARKLFEFLDPITQTI